MKKLICAALMFFCVSALNAGADSIYAGYKADSARFVIEGSISAYAEGKDANLLIVKKGVSADEITADDIAYIKSTKILPGGKYKFDFTFNKSIDDYNVFIRQANQNITPSVTNADMILDCVKLDTDFEIIDSQYGKKYLKISNDVKNYFDISFESYNIIAAFYSDNSLIGTEIFTDDELSVSRTVELPEGTNTAKCFIWNAVADLKPLSASKEKASSDMTFSDGDRVLCIGDSITHYSDYEREIEHFYQTRYPNRNISFVNLGIAGDTTAGILNRLEWDIKPASGDKAIILIGVNDIQTMGEYNTALTNLSAIADELTDKNVDITLLGGVMYDSDEGYSTQSNNTRVDPLLYEYKNAVKELAAEKCVKYIELYDYLHEITDSVREANPNADAIMSKDRIHPNDAGFLIITQLIAKQQGANPYVSYTELDALTGDTVDVKNAEIEDIVISNDNVSYTYLPKSIPLANTDAYKTADKMYDITNTNNLEIIKITNLNEGTYGISIDGTLLGSYTNSELAEGVNIAVLENNPSQLQAQKAYKANQIRHEEELKLRSIQYTIRNMIADNVDVSDEAAAMAWVEEKLTNPDLPVHTAGYYKGYKNNFNSQDKIKSVMLSNYEGAKATSVPAVHTVTVTKQ